uniref:Purinergic receptor P2Y13 n=1 Tax=Echeneis naucrates TaxID=173247 RepID=A0A665U3V2_ECHNA
MPSTQTSGGDLECKRHLYLQIIVPILYFLMFPLALMLNTVASWVSVHLKSTSTFLVYLKNLVAADFIMTLIIPIKAASDLPGASSTLFELSCNYFRAIYYSTQYTCIALLGFISLDRFFKIMIPQLKFTQNVTFSKVLSGSVWIILFGGTALPNILSNGQISNNRTYTSCMKFKGKNGLKVHGTIVMSLNIFFWFVSVVITVCYISIANRVIQSFRNSGSNNNQGKQKVKLRVFLIVIVFFVSFTPYHIYRIPYTILQINQSSKTCPYSIPKLCKELSLWLCSTNICMDPLLYVFLCREFKEKLVSLMKNIFPSFKVDSAAKEEVASTQSRHLPGVIKIKINTLH